MSENAGFENTSSVVESQGSSENEITGQSGGDKPYAQYLADLPASVVPLVEPIFQKWDSDTGRRFQQVHSEYEPLKQYQQFAEAGIDPVELQQAYSVLDRLRSDPKTVFDTIGRTYGFLGEQGQQDTEEPGSEDYSIEGLESDPRFAGLQNMTRTMAEYLVQQEEQKQADLADQQVDQEISELREKYGDFDETFVLTQMLNGSTGEQAVQLFNQIVENALAVKKAPAAPTILGSGGGIVSEPVNVSKMTPAERKAYVVERLAQASQE